jgi:hypothetical protein
MNRRILSGSKVNRDCPCSEGFQPRWLAMSPKLRSALEQRDASTRTALREMNR